MFWSQVGWCNIPLVFWNRNVTAHYFPQPISVTPFPSLQYCWDGASLLVVPFSCHQKHFDAWFDELNAGQFQVQHRWKHTSSCREKEMEDRKQQQAEVISSWVFSKHPGKNYIHWRLRCSKSECARRHGDSRHNCKHKGNNIILLHVARFSFKISEQGASGSVPCSGKSKFTWLGLLPCFDFWGLQWPRVFLCTLVSGGWRKQKISLNTQCSSMHVDLADSYIDGHTLFQKFSLSTRMCIYFCAFSPRKG